MKLMKRCCCSVKKQSEMYNRFWSFFFQNQICCYFPLLYKVFFWSWCQYLVVLLYFVVLLVSRLSGFHCSVTSWLQREMKHQDGLQSRTKWREAERPDGREGVSNRQPQSFVRVKNKWNRRNFEGSLPEFTSFKLGPSGGFRPETKCWMSWPHLEECLESDSCVDPFQRVWARWSGGSQAGRQFLKWDAAADLKEHFSAASDSSTQRHSASEEYQYWFVCR